MGLIHWRLVKKWSYAQMAHLVRLKKHNFFFTHLCHSILMFSLHTLRSCNKWNLYNLCVRLINLFLCRVWTLIYNKHNFHVICNIILNSKENKFNLVMINCICKYCFLSSNAITLKKNKRRWKGFIQPFKIRPYGQGLLTCM